MTEPLTVSVAELRAHLSDYLREAGEGRIIYITSRGYRVAAIIPVTDAKTLEGKR